MKKVPKDIGWLGIIMRIFDNSHSLLITAITTVSSATVYAIAYLYDRIVALVWNIPADFIQDMNSRATIYYIVVGILSSIAMFVTQVILRSVFSDLIVRLYFIRILKRILKIFKQNLKRFDKTCCKKYSRYSRDLVKNRQFVRSERRRLIVKSGIYLSASCVAFLPVYLIFQIITSDKFNPVSLATGAILVSISVFTSAYLQIRVSLLNQKPKIYGLLRESRSSSNDLYSCVKLIAETQKEFDKWKNESVKPDNKLYQIASTISRFDVYGIIASTIVIAFLLLAMGFVAPLSRRSFWVCDDDGRTYVAIYFNGEKVVFKNAIIDGDNIQIKLDEQKYEQYDERYMIHRTFENVVLERN